MPNVPVPTTTHCLPERAIDVLVVATDAPARARLAAHVWGALPLAQVHELSQVTDLVYRVAGRGVDLVLLDAEPLQPLPLTPLLVQMLRGIQPAMRIVCVARAEPACAPATDGSLSEASLGDWLRTSYGRIGADAPSSAVSSPASNPSASCRR